MSREKLIAALIEYRKLTNTPNFLLYFNNADNFVIQEDTWGENILVEVGEPFDFSTPISYTFPLLSDPAEVADNLIRDHF